MEILNYKCPNCSAGLEFNSKTQKMACEYCGNSYTVEELEELEEQKEEPLKEEAVSYTHLSDRFSDG